MFIPGFATALFAARIKEGHGQPLGGMVDVENPVLELALGCTALRSTCGTPR